MSTQNPSMTYKAPILLIVASVAALIVWFSASSVFDLPGIVDVTHSGIFQCRDSADIMASLDRSRNGISLTCNSDTSLKGAAL